ncbi:MAG TPA: hypothetical protein VKR53_20455 [Puia sp.]|nr:hypothetical protein [Puia sp.]
MEVHHHPDLHHKRKKFREYFLEFLMIFLAVTMGFFAESYREHLVDKRSEKEIITALFNDVKKDTANLNTIITLYMPEHEAWEDSVETLIKTLPAKGNDKKFAMALINATNWNFYSPPQVSLEILKNSGNFNLIKSANIKSEIINFNGLITTYANYSQFMLATEHAIDTATAGIINRDALRILIASVYLKTNAEYGSIAENDVPVNTVLKTYDKNVFLHYMDKLDAMDYLLNDLLGLYKKVLKEESILLHALNEEYHLENE